MSKQSAPNILENNIVESEINHLRNIDAFMQLAVEYIDKEVDSLLYLDKDEDLDYEPFEDIKIEFCYFDTRVWVDFKLYNDWYDITDVSVKNDDDIDYIYIANWLKADLINYYNKESVTRATSYKQALEIKQEQNDPYDLKPNEAIGFEINKNHLTVLQSICEEDNSKICQFLQHGYALKLKLKKGVSSTHLVKTILPIINDGVFVQVNRLSLKKEMASFIHDNFMKYNGDSLSLKSLSNPISRFFWAS